MTEQEKKILFTEYFNKERFFASLLSTESLKARIVDLEEVVIMGRARLEAAIEVLANPNFNGDVEM